MTGLDILNSEMAECRRCELSENSIDPHVIGCGSLNSKIIFVSESPSMVDNNMNSPLSEESTDGKRFKNILKALSLSRDDVYITNSVMCLTCDEDPLQHQLLACRYNLEKQIKLVDPKLVVTFGRFATESMLGYTKISKDRGKIHHSVRFGIDVYPMYHLSYLASYSKISGREEFKKDIENLKRIVSKL